MTAKTTSWRLIVPPFLEYLEEKLNHRIRLHQNELGYDIYLVDFSSWRLRLSDHTPVIVVTETDLRNSSDDEIAQSISDVIRIRGYDSRMSLVVVQGDGAALREYFRASYTSALILDDRDQNEIVESRRPTVELLRRLSSQIQLSFLSPYETSKPVTGSRFFGRESIVRRVLMDRSANFAIMGIRRIGKTSLLKEIQARLREDEESDMCTNPCTASGHQESWSWMGFLLACRPQQEMWLTMT